MEFTAQSVERDGCMVVSAHGELDAYAAPILQAQIDPLTTVPRVRLVVDLTDVGFIDSTGLGVLVATLKQVRQADGRLEVVAVAPRVLKVFSLTGLDAVISLHASLDEALVSA